MAAKPALPTETVDGFLKSLLVLSRGVTHILEERAVAQAIEEPLSSSKVQILRLLAQRGMQTSTRVARFLGVSKPAVTQIIESMVRDRLVSRQTGQVDRREVGLKLTKRGRDRYAALQRRQRHLARAAAQFSNKADPTLWTKTLDDITSALAKADRTFKQYCLQCGAHSDGTCLLDGGHADCHYLQHQSSRRKAKVGMTNRRTAKKKTARKAKRATRSY